MCSLDLGSLISVQDRSMFGSPVLRWVEHLPRCVHCPPLRQHPEAAQSCRLDDSRQCMKMRLLIAHISRCHSRSIPSIRLSRMPRMSGVAKVQWLPAGLKHHRGPLPENLTLVSRQMDPNIAEVDLTLALFSAMAVHLPPWPRLLRMAWGGCQAPHLHRVISVHALIPIASLTVHVWIGPIAWLKRHLCCRNSCSTPSNRCPGPCILLVERTGLNRIQQLSMHNS